MYSNKMADARYKIRTLMIRMASDQLKTATNLFIGDIPIIPGNETLESTLLRSGIKPLSKLIMEGIRDPNGKFTNWITDRRMVWSDLPKTPPQHITVL